MASGRASFRKESVSTGKSGSVLSLVKYEHLVAGISGGVISTLVLHPLDLIKIRFAVDDGVTKRPEYKGLLHAFRSIVRQNGFQGLYQGATPNIWGAGMSWGFYFLLYNAIKTGMQGDQTAPLAASQHMLAAAEAGVITLIITNPLWVVKTRLCLQYETTVPNIDSNKYYKGMSDALFKVYRYEGIRGLYKGFVPGMFGVSHGALQFMAYEELKKSYNTYRHRPSDAKFTSVEYLSFAALSKLFAASITYPYQVVRARLQDQHRHYDGVIDVLRKTWRYEGMAGFYKGLMPYLAHVTPNICIIFLLYEKFSPQQHTEPDDCK